MKIDTVKSIQDVRDCVDLYMAVNDDEFMLAERDVALRNIELVARRQKFFRVIRDNDKIIACLIADIAGNCHTSLRILNQQYFACNQTGTKAYKCIQLLHQELIEYAEENKYPLVSSSGSHFDPGNVFARILEKQGWMRKHFLCIWRTSHYQEYARKVISKPGLTTADTHSGP
jgi:hypothetical protein